MDVSILNKLGIENSNGEEVEKADEETLKNIESTSNVDFINSFRSESPLSLTSVTSVDSDEDPLKI